MNRSRLTATGVILFAAAAVHAQSVAPARLRAGAHKVSFTPNQSELQISTDSIRDPLFARAILVDDGSTCAVLVSIDLGAAPNQVVDDAISRASKSTGCPAQNVVSDPRLKPGCAEGRIVSTAIDLMRRSGQ